MLYSNSLLFQTPPQSDDTDQFYGNAAAAYEKILQESDILPDLAAQVYNNMGVALFAQGLQPGKLGPARQAFTQAIILQPDQPWPYFNRAYAQLYDIEQNPDQKQSITDDCKQVVQAGKAQDNTLIQAAGYTCLVEQLLADGPNAHHENEINHLLKNIEADDYPPPYVLRGIFYFFTNQLVPAREMYACYLLRMRDRVKLPIETGRIEPAQDNLKSVFQPLEQLCPISFGGF